MGKSKEFSGEIDDVSPEQKQVYDKFKDHVENTQNINNSLYDEWFMLRFCRARKFDLPKVILMFENYHKWQEENKIFDLVKQDWSDITSQQSSTFPHSYFGVTKTGVPVYIERYSKIDIHKMISDFSEERITNYYINSYLTLIYVILPECSRIAGKRIDRCCTILDVKGLGVMKQQNSDTKKQIKLGVSVAQDYFPEIMWKTYIVNTNWMFSSLWSIVKMFIDAKTKAKIVLEGSSYQKELLQDIDASQLPTWLGGTSKYDLGDSDHLPWREYQLNCIKNKSYIGDGIQVSNPMKEHLRKQKREEAQKLEIKERKVQNYRDEEFNTQIDSLIEINIDEGEHNSLLLQHRKEYSASANLVF